MKRYRTRICCVLVAFVASAGCVATDVGNPQDGERDGGGETVDVRVRFEGLKEAPDPNALVLSGGTEIQSVWVGVSQPGLRPKGSCGERADAVSGETRAVELLGGDASRAVAVPNRPVGTYCGFDFALDQVSSSDRPSGAPEALGGRSVLVLGERSDGTNFQIRGEFEPDVKMRAGGSDFRIEGGRRDLLSSFAMEGWIETEALEAIEGESPIIVDASSHPEVFEPFREAFAASVFLFRDEDANGRSDPSERDEVLASTLAQDERDGEEESD